MAITFSINRVLGNVIFFCKCQPWNETRNICWRANISFTYLVLFNPAGLSSFLILCSSLAALSRFSSVMFNFIPTCLVIILLSLLYHALPCFTMLYHALPCFTFFCTIAFPCIAFSVKNFTIQNSRKIVVVKLFLFYLGQNEEERTLL